MLVQIPAVEEVVVTDVTDVTDAITLEMDAMDLVIVLEMALAEDLILFG